jgi:hypothetical protein
VRRRSDAPNPAGNGSHVGTAGKHQRPARLSSGHYRLLDHTSENQLKIDRPLHRPIFFDRSYVVIGRPSDICHSPYTVRKLQMKKMTYVTGL